MEFQRVVIDTDVMIYLEKKKMIERFLEKYEIMITFISLYEYIRGLRRIGKGEELIRKVKKRIEDVFEVIWPSNETLIVASRVWNELSRRGLLLDERDLLIGAICIERNLPLWTMNLKHFERLKEYGLILFQPE